MTLTEEIRSDILAMEADLGNPFFTWDDQDYACVPSPTKAIFTPDVGTMNIDRMLTLLARKEQFTDGVFPRGQQFLVYQDQRYTILQVDRDAFGVSLRLTCVEDNRGAHG